MTNSGFYFDPGGQGSGIFLGPTESELMELAWRLDRITVKKALFELKRENKLAYTTVMTVLNRLTEKGLLKRNREGRNFIYTPRVSRNEFIGSRLKLINACLEKNFPN